MTGIPSCWARSFRGVAWPLQAHETLEWVASAQQVCEVAARRSSSASWPTARPRPTGFARASSQGPLCFGCGFQQTGRQLSSPNMRWPRGPGRGTIVFLSSRAPATLRDPVRRNGRLRSSALIISKLIQKRVSNSPRVFPTRSSDGARPALGLPFRKPIGIVATIPEPVRDRVSHRRDKMKLGRTMEARCRNLGPAHHAGIPVLRHLACDPARDGRQLAETLSNSPKCLGSGRR